MLLIGSHVSFKSNDQLLGSAKEAISYGSTTFMFYTGAPQNTNRSPINDKLTEEAIKLMNDNNIDIKNVVVHAPYIINLANKEKQEFSVNFLKEEIKRVEKLGVNKLVLHPGSYVNYGLDAGINNVIDSLNLAVDENQKVDICLETMAGKGTEVGFKLEHIKKIIDGVKYNNKIKVCLDTCHLNDAGYDMSEFDKFLDYFDKIIGINKISVVHINDSKNELGSHKDRHENIGFGCIGFNNLINVIYNTKLENIPKILETPYTGDTRESKERLYPPYKFEIDMIRKKVFNENLDEDVKKYYK